MLHITFFIAHKLETISFLDQMLGRPLDLQSPLAYNQRYILAQPLHIGLVAYTPYKHIRKQIYPYKVQVFIFILAKNQTFSNKLDKSLLVRKTWMR